MTQPDATSTGDSGQPVHGLDPGYYTDPAVFEREKRGVFFRTWQYAGHVSQVQGRGDYFTYAICGQHLFTIRDAGGLIRSFHNVCMHRAHPIVHGAGHKRVLVCPYHAWTYELDGRLRKAPNDENVVGFDRDGICLAEVRTEILCGFIFVNLDRDARAMAHWFPGVERELRGYVPHIDRLVPRAPVAVDEQCNWKVTVENYSECYHCRLNHPTFSRGVVDPGSYNVLAQGYCLRHTTRTAPLENLSYAIDAKANEHAAHYSAWFLWPAFSFQVYPGNVLNTYLWRPVDVGRTMVYRGWYSIDGEPSEAVSKLARQDRDTTVAEDLRLVNAVQQGLGSLGYRPGPLVIDPRTGVNSEHSVRAIHEWVLEAIDGGR